MTIESNGIKGLAHFEPADAPVSGVKAISVWGMALVATGFAVLALGLVWFKDDWVHTPSLEDKRTASLWILGALAGLLLFTLFSSRIGAFRVAGVLFRRQAGPVSPAQVVAVPKRDPRLTELRAELRASHGWRWRYHQPWLLVTGEAELTEAVAPGLSKSGFALTEHAVLLHASPDGIDGPAWRAQLRRLRHQRPVDAVVQVMRTGDTSRLDGELPRTLATQAVDLKWAAPVWLLHAVPVRGSQTDTYVPVGLSLPEHTDDSIALDHALAMIMRESAMKGIRLLVQPSQVTYLAALSAYMDVQRARIVAGLQALAVSKWRRAPLAGMMFAPAFDGAAGSVVNADDELKPLQPPSIQPTWQQISSMASGQRGKRIGFYWPNALATLAMAGAIAWCIALTVSFVGNRQLAANAQANVRAALAATPGTAAALRTQLALQQTIAMLEYRQQHGAPWYLRAGLARNDAVLAELWPPYQTVSERNLRRPVTLALEASLTSLGQLAADSVQDHDAMRCGYNQLKAYLMLADPRRTDAAFLQPQILAAWPAPAGMPPGEWLDTSQRLAKFYADHLQAHPAWRMRVGNPYDSPTSNAIVAAARTTLINQIDLSNADDTLYQRVVDGVKGKYSDAMLVTLLNGTDARGLFATARSVPGLYTRAAWEGAVAEAIERVSRERSSGGDWVLAPEPAQPETSLVAQGAVLLQDAVAPQATAIQQGSPEEIKARLTARYFADYTGAWQSFLNSIQWQPASNLRGAIDQLTRLADAQQSPLIALMQSVQYQAHAGRSSEALSDTLVRKAQGLLHGTDNDPATRVLPVNPLDKSFGPLLALMGDTGDGAAANANHGAAYNAAAAGNFGLAHYLRLVTTARLKLQQISASQNPQAMARSLAQAVFQGKLSDLMQARDDASLSAASLGGQWAGFGDALLVHPLDTAWQTILAPAAASLNESWSVGLALPFKSAFNGRYPFADTSVDASFAELGRYVRPDTGLIAKFIATQLAGVLQQQGDAWVPNELAPQALQFDPLFLKALAQLSTLGARLYTQGDAGYRFELMPLPTESVTRTELTIDGKPVVYFNQQESWTKIGWPGNGLNGHASLTWQTVDAGTRQAFESTGDWAFLRLLEKARTKQLDSTRYALTWPQPDAQALRYVLRTQLGAGPLALLKLRGFKMPERIFMVGDRTTAVATSPTRLPEIEP